MLKELIDGFGYEGEVFNNIHLLHLDEKGERAEALCYVSSDDMLMKLQLLRHEDVWYLIEIVIPDNGLRMMTETFDPVLKSIDATRSGKRGRPGALSDFRSALTILDDEPEKALETIDRILQTKPGDRDIKFLKGIALLNLEKLDEATKLLSELGNEQHAQALYRLAGELQETKPEEAIELYKRYTSLEPHDLRGHRDLAIVYDNLKQTELAEAGYRKAIAVDPSEIPGYVNLISFLILNGRLGDVGPVFRESDKYAGPDTDVLATVLSDLEMDIELKDAEKLAAAEAHRLKTSVWANLTLSDIYVREKRYATALEVIKRAEQISPEYAHPHIAKSSVYVKMMRLNDALTAANRAVSLDQNSASAHYVQAIALARLGRKKQAMAALEKSIEIDAHVASWIAEEEGFKSLRSLPAFKKWVSDAEKQSEGP